MTSKAIVIGYHSNPLALQFDPFGDFVIYADVLYTDTIDARKKFYNQPVITLPRASPTRWPDVIRQALANNGIANGFTDLIPAEVQILSWPVFYREQLGARAAVINVGATPQILATFQTFEDGLLNLANRRMTVTGTIAYSTGVLENPTITLAFEIVDRNSDVLGLISIASLAVGGSNNDSPIRFSFDTVVDTPGSSAVFIGTGHMLVTNNALLTILRNMLPDWLSTNQIDVTKEVTARLTISASSNLASAHLVEAFLKVE